MQHLLVGLRTENLKSRVEKVGKREETMVLYCCHVSLVKCCGKFMTLTKDKLLLT